MWVAGRLLAVLVLALALRLPQVSGRNRMARLFDTPEGVPIKVDFRNRSISINSEHTIVLAAGVHYTRATPDEWERILFHTKRAAFNAVQIPIPWGEHEPEMNEKQVTFETAGSKNISAFLERAAAHDLFAVVHVGPGSCADSVAGGLPPWLERRGVAIRNPFNDFWGGPLNDFLDFLLTDVLYKRMAPRGGPVIAVTMEPCGCAVSALQWHREMSLSEWDVELLPHVQENVDGLRKRLGLASDDDAVLGLERSSVFPSVFTHSKKKNEWSFAFKMLWEGFNEEEGKITALERAAVEKKADESNPRRQKKGKPNADASRLLKDLEARRRGAVLIAHSLWMIDTVERHLTNSQTPIPVISCVRPSLIELWRLLVALNRLYELYLRNSPRGPNTPTRHQSKKQQDQQGPQSTGGGSLEPPVNPEGGGGGAEASESHDSPTDLEVSSSVVAGCQGFHCSVWTEKYCSDGITPCVWASNWLTMETEWDSPKAQRPPEHVAWSVVDFLAHGGSFISFHGFFGGSHGDLPGTGEARNFPPSSQYDGPLEDNGMPNWRYYWHLAELNAFVNRVTRVLIRPFGSTLPPRTPVVAERKPSYAHTGARTAGGGAAVWSLPVPGLVSASVALDDQVLEVKWGTVLFVINNGAVPVQAKDKGLVLPRSALVLLDDVEKPGEPQFNSSRLFFDVQDSVLKFDDERRALARKGTEPISMSPTPESDGGEGESMRHQQQLRDLEEYYGVDYRGLSLDPESETKVQFLQELVGGIRDTQQEPVRNFAVYNRKAITAAFLRNKIFVMPVQSAPSSEGPPGSTAISQSVIPDPPPAEEPLPRRSKAANRSAEIDNIARDCLDAGGSVLFPGIRRPSSLSKTFSAFGQVPEYVWYEFDLDGLVSGFARFPSLSSYAPSSKYLARWREGQRELDIRFPPEAATEFDLLLLFADGEFVSSWRRPGTERTTAGGAHVERGGDANNWNGGLPVLSVSSCASFVSILSVRMGSDSPTVKTSQRLTAEKLRGYIYPSLGLSSRELRKEREREIREGGPPTAEGKQTRQKQKREQGNRGRGVGKKTGGGGPSPVSADPSSVVVSQERLWMIGWIHKIRLQGERLQLPESPENMEWMMKGGKEKEEETVDQGISKRALDDEREEEDGSVIERSFHERGGPTWWGLEFDTCFAGGEGEGRGDLRRGRKELVTGEAWRREAAFFLQLFPEDFLPSDGDAGVLTVGEVILNGRSLGRVWNATASDRVVGADGETLSAVENCAFWEWDPSVCREGMGELAQPRLRIPSQWLRECGEPNFLVVLDLVGSPLRGLKVVAMKRRDEEPLRPLGMDFFKLDVLNPHKKKYPQYRHWGFGEQKEPQEDQKEDLRQKHKLQRQRLDGLLKEMGQRRSSKHESETVLIYLLCGGAFFLLSFVCILCLDACRQAHNRRLNEHVCGLSAAAAAAAIMPPPGRGPMGIGRQVFIYSPLSSEPAQTSGAGGTAGGGTACR
uniref:Glycoside hydrolase 35 catalytic domain-containing protein n=1 Tax=Chromera velia CCMP2878 TaxID=1169474 RepID=A0A0K6S8L4_9ALVE|eukprot:Cvel_25014.t1-p1 / transcript=Cvel_25014.t1 / gene=Cvel_25014 / organism=Chromera_velia_CCMP2878 / gene_product=Probable beta-galactosidase 2, putative / transcript_product=Probable beta-galactosidase 2, putative / location=Cvel_scaffold2773:10395-20310(-) / protein_length=1477 / sequence_SO=supercontig / SO=protein_coding / is_pseudo=false